MGRSGAETDLKAQAWVCLVIMAYILEEQARELFTFFYRHGKNLRRSKSARSNLKKDWLVGRIDNWVLIASVIFVCTRLVRADDPQAANAQPEVRVMIAIAASLAWLQVFLNSFVPFERFGVFVLLVSRMVFGDMTTWALIVLPWVMGLTTSANAVSPDATKAPFLGEGGHSLSYWPNSLEAFFFMISNGVTPQFQAYHYGDTIMADGGLGDGEGQSVVSRLLKNRAETDFGEEGVGEKDETDYPSLLLGDPEYSKWLGVSFYVFYAVFCYVVLIMLLNLLIAMMGNTCALDSDQTLARPNPRQWLSDGCAARQTPRRWNKPRWNGEESSRGSSSRWVRASRVSNRKPMDLRRSHICLRAVPFHRAELLQHAHGKAAWCGQTHPLRRAPHKTGRPASRQRKRGRGHGAP